MRPTDEHQTPSTRPNFMTATKRVGGSGENILARLDRSDHAARPSWTHATKGALVGALLATVALIWMLINFTQDKLQGQRAAPVIVATPMTEAAVPARVELPAEPSLEAQAAAQVEAALEARHGALPAHAEKPLEAPAEALSLEPIPDLPMLADVVEKAPAAPTRPTRPARARANQAAPAAKSNGAMTARAGERAGAPPATGGTGQEGAVDSDVALLSALLLHAPRHSAERAKAEAKCRLDKNCTWVGPLPALLQAAH